MSESRLISIGTIIKHHGLKGQVRVAMSEETMSRIRKLGPLLFEKGNERKILQVETTMRAGKFAVLKFEGYDSPEDAELLRNGEILVEEKQLGAAPKDSYYQFELIDFVVQFESGERLGHVRDVIDYPSCDTLEVFSVAGKELLIPMTKAIVLDIRKESKTIVVSKEALGELL